MSGILFFVFLFKMLDDKFKVFDIIDLMFMEIEFDRQFFFLINCYKDWDFYLLRNEEDDDEWMVVQKRWKIFLWNMDNEFKYSFVFFVVDLSLEVVVQFIVLVEFKM